MVRTNQGSMGTAFIQSEINYYTELNFGFNKNDLLDMGDYCSLPQIIQKHQRAITGTKKYHRQIHSPFKLLYSHFMYLGL